MPGTTNGLGVARFARENQPNLPIVLMTGHAAEVHRAVADGFVVLAKPCGPDVLGHALLRALGGAARAPLCAAAAAVPDAAGTRRGGVEGQASGNAP
jgi:CheY-like chemotaxis protein